MSERNLPVGSRALSAGFAVLMILGVGAAGASTGAVGGLTGMHGGPSRNPYENGRSAAETSALMSQWMHYGAEDPDAVQPSDCDVEAHGGAAGLALAMEIIEANCERQPQAEGLPIAAESLGDNADRQGAHDSGDTHDAGKHVAEAEGRDTDHGGGGNGSPPTRRGRDGRR